NRIPLDHTHARLLARFVSNEFHARRSLLGPHYTGVSALCGKSPCEPGQQQHILNQPPDAYLARLGQWAGPSAEALSRCRWLRENFDSPSAWRAWARKGRLRSWSAPGSSRPRAATSFTSRSASLTSPPPTTPGCYS